MIPHLSIRGGALAICFALVARAGAQNADVDAASVPTTPPQIVAAIVQNDDPMTANVFLGDSRMQAAVKAAEPAQFDAVFQHAAELQDVERLLTSTVDPMNIRLTLLSRGDCAFCQNPTRLEAWAARDRAVIPSIIKILPFVFFDWKTLSSSQLNFLQAYGTTAADWNALTLQARQERLLSWAREAMSSLMTDNPSTPQQIKDMAARAYSVYGVLGRDETSPLFNRLNKADTAVQKLAAADKLVGSGAAAGLRQTLADAQNASDPEARLAALNRLYDAMGRPDAQVRAALPTAPGQGFDAASRQRTAALLSTGLMNETRGTWAGADLSAFFANHPLDVVVRPFAGQDVSAAAEYDNNRLSLNEKFIAEFVRSRGKTIDDLSRDPALLRDLTRTVAPEFVHESTHEMQDAWAKAQGIPFQNGEGVEQEALTVQALFVLQKEKIDPSYRRFLEANKNSSTLVANDLWQAENLKKDGASYYGASVFSDNYPGYPSIASNAWTGLAVRAQAEAAIQAELARRAQLPSTEQARLAATPGFQAETMSDYIKAVPKMGTSALTNELTLLRGDDTRTPRIYNDYATRLAGVVSSTDQRLAQLGIHTPAADPVPVPSLVAQ